MKVVRAVLIGRDVPGWPEAVIVDTVPLGRVYRVDLDSKDLATLRNLAHPEWGTVEIQAVVDVDDGFPLPVCCLRIEP